MKFKNIITALFVMLTAFIGYSCTEDADVAALETELSLSSTYFGTTQEGGEQVVSISSNAEWTITQSADADWMAIDKNSGSNNGDFTITVDPNTTVSAREVTLVVTSDDTSEIVLVSQTKGDETLTVEPAEKTTTSRSAKEDITFTVTANTIWDASVSYEAGHEEWVTLSKTTGSGETEVGVTVTENPFVSDRTATLSFLTASNTTYKYLIVQSFGDATISIEKLDVFAGTASAKWAKVTSNNAWSVATPEANWVTIATSTGSSDVKGSGDGTFQVSVTDNPTAKQRETTLYVDYGAESNEKAELAVVQNGAASTISVADPQFAEFDSEGGSVTFKVTSNDTWTVEIPEAYNGDWTVTYEDGLDEIEAERTTTFTLELPANDGTAISATIKVVCDEDNTKFVNIPVTQTTEAEDGALSVEVSDNDDVIVKAGATLNVTVGGTEAWTAKLEYDGKDYYDDTFLTLSAATGDADVDFTITVAENNNTTSRVGTVIVTSAVTGVVRKISVTQAAGDATLSRVVLDDDSASVDETAIPAAGGAYVLKVTSNTTYNVALDWKRTYWMTLPDGTYTHDKSINMNIEENMTFEDRTQQININNIEGISGNKNITLKQLASTGSLSVPEVNATADFDFVNDLVAIKNVGGSFQMHIKHNVEYSVTYEYDSDEYADWIELTNTNSTTLASSYTDICTFTVSESENYTAATEENDVIDTGYIVIKPTDATTYSSLGDYRIAVTLGAFMAKEPTYTLSKVSSTELKVAIDNTKFKVDPEFSTSDFKVSYTNDYAGSKSASGELAVSAVAWDSENPSYVTLTVATMYNTDEITVEYVGSTTSTVLANTKYFKFESGSIESDYVEFLYADFETEGKDTNFYVAENSIGRSNALKMLDGSLSETNCYYPNPYKDGVNTSDYCFYSQGTDNAKASCLVLCSDPFATLPFNDLKLNFSVKVCLLDTPFSDTANSGLSLAFNVSTSTSTQAGGNKYWSITDWAWVTIGQGTFGTWKTQTGNVTQTADGVDVSFDDMCMTIRYNTMKNACLFDDFVLGNAEARPE